eukprot:TRINITY_DN167_c0_g1_i2.p1 TRINITY_DN167_c0_g1~~TRINITY_DN167_c0_g1_i2.p1  ORF type:complete len:273 (-),score=87.22 TRINITY_DN167_c0_g1_i2:45-863(-)
MSKRGSAPTAGRPDVFKKTYGGRLEGALEILKTRYTRDFPYFLKAMEGYQQALTALTDAGRKLSGELSKMGSLHKNEHGQTWGRLGQKLVDVEGTRTTLINNVVKEFTSPMTKALASDKKAFAANEKKVKTTMAQYDSEIERLISQLDKEQPHGTDRMLVNLGALSKKTTEFDNVNAEMLRDLQQSQQKQYITWSEHWHKVVSAHLQYHEKMEKKLTDLQPLWQGSDAAGSTPAATDGGDDDTAAKPSAAAPAPAPKTDSKGKAGKKDKGKK